MTAPRAVFEYFGDQKLQNLVSFLTTLTAHGPLGGGTMLGRRCPKLCTFILGFIVDKFWLGNKNMLARPCAKNDSQLKI
jgi:hypothetical protein